MIALTVLLFYSSWSFRRVISRHTGSVPAEKFCLDLALALGHALASPIMQSGTHSSSLRETWNEFTLALHAPASEEFGPFYWIYRLTRALLSYVIFHSKLHRVIPWLRPLLYGELLFFASLRIPCKPSSNSISCTNFVKLVISCHLTKDHVLE